MQEANMKRPNGTTALMEAAYKGNTACVQLLLQEAKAQTNEGGTALMYAADRGHPDCVQLLLQEVGMQNMEGKTALILACTSAICSEKLESVKFLLDEIFAVDNRGKTALDYLDDDSEEAEKLSGSGFGRKSVERYNATQKMFEQKCKELMDAPRNENAAIQEKLTEVKQDIAQVRGENGLIIRTLLGDDQ